MNRHKHLNFLACITKERIEPFSYIKGKPSTVPISTLAG